MRGQVIKTIARNVLGDSSLWWRIAEANGLAVSGDGELQAGQTLSIPKLALNANNADTFQPYDPSRVTGSLDSVLPAPAGQGGGCGALGKIIMVAVAVVAAVYTAGALAAAGSLGSNALGAATLSGVTTGGGFGATMAAGGMVLGGTAGAGAAMVAGVAGGALSSIASQAAGNLLGVQDGFSWKGVALSALSGGVSGGLAGSSLLGGSSIDKLLLRSAAGNALTQGIGIATGLQSSFSWRSIAASAAGAVAGGYVGKQLDSPGLFSGWDTTAAEILKGSISGFTAGTVTAIARGGSISMQQVATDVFGNALGQSLAAVASQVSTPGLSVQEDRLGAFIQENLGAWTQRQANYDQLVDSFGNYTSDSRADGVQLAAGADYTGGIGSGLSDREANIARMLKLANDPQAMGSLRGPDGIYRLEIAGIGSTGAGDGTRWIPDTDSLAGKRMTQMDEFDRLNAAEMIDAKAARYGSITAYQPSVWERTWLSRDVQNALGSSFTGMVVGSVVNAAGSISASIRSDRYNFATGKYLNPVEQRNARIDNLINWATLPLGGGTIGARSGLQGVRTARLGNAASEVPTVRGFIVNSADAGAVDAFGRAVTPRTQSILEKFGDARRVLVLDETTGKATPVQIVNGLRANEVRVGDLGKLQAATGNEFSLMRGPGGERVLIQGEMNATGIPGQYAGEGWTWSGHSHPYSAVASDTDRALLRALGQESSMIKSAATGQQLRFTQFEDLSNWKPPVTIR